MPLPTKRKTEKDNEFISRCMSDEVMNREFPKQKQRTAVCFSQLRRSKNIKNTETLTEGADKMSFKHTYQVADQEPKWGTVDKTKLPRIAHAVMGEADKKSTWGYPHHFCQGATKLDDDGVYTDGKLYAHKGGIVAAYQRAKQQNLVGEGITHIQGHRKDLIRKKLILATEENPHLATIDYDDEKGYGFPGAKYPDGFPAEYEKLTYGESPYEVPYPKPKELDFSEGPVAYSYPIPTEKRCDDKDGWISLCEFADQCNDDCGTCEFAAKFGCPLLFAHVYESVNIIETFDEKTKYGPTLKNVALLGFDAPAVKTLKDVESYYEGKDPAPLTGVEIFDAGNHNGRDFDIPFIDNVVDNFGKLGKLVKVPLGMLPEKQPGMKIGHSGKFAKTDDGNPSLGWVENLYRKGTKLIADFAKVPALVHRLIRNGAYKKISSELYPNFAASETSIVSDFEDGTDVIVLEFGATNKEVLMDPEKTTDATDATDKAPDVATPPVDDSKLKELEARLTETETKLTEAESRLSSADETILKMENERREKAVEIFIDQMVDDNGVQRILPKQKNMVRALMLSLNTPDKIEFTEGDDKVETDQLKLFKDFVSNIKQNDLTVQTTSRDADADNVGSQDTLNGRVEKIRKEAKDNGEELDEYTALVMAEKQMKDEGFNMSDLVLGPRDE